MKAYIYNLEGKSKIDRPSVIALGAFYTMHIGHQEIIDQTIKQAKKNNYLAGIILFNETENFMPKKELYSLNWRVNYALEQGFDFVIIFDKTITNYAIEPLDFIASLKRQYQSQMFVCGQDFSFGKNRSMSAIKLADHEKTIIVKNKKINNQKISSTLIFSLLKENDYQLVQQLLGRHPSFSGQVIGGEKVGRTLNCPTANIEIDQKLKNFNDGIYISLTKYENLLYPSLTSIGKKETFHKNWDQTYETHILNFNKDIYNKSLEVFIIKKIRNQKKFDSFEELNQAILQDKDDAITWFKNNKF